MIIGGNFLKATDVKEGDLIKIVSTGEKVKSEKWTYNDGNPKIEYRFEVELGDKTIKTLSMNKVSRDNLCNAFGSDTELWKDKIVIVHLESALVNGQRKMVIELRPQE